MPREDRVLVSGRREGVVVMILWVIGLVYSVGYCYLFGYGGSAEDLQFVLWFPDWVFWGIVVPWLALVVVGIWFALWMTDDDLGEPGEEPPDVAEELLGRGGDNG